MAEAGWPAPLLETGTPEPLTTRLRCIMARLDETESVAQHIGTNSGGVAILNLDANRVRREFTGHFYKDAARSLDHLASEVDQLRAELGLSTREDCA